MRCLNIVAAKDQERVSALVIVVCGPIHKLNEQSKGLNTYYPLRFRTGRNKLWQLEPLELCGKLRGYPRFLTTGTLPPYLEGWPLRTTDCLQCRRCC